jgi:DNA-binding NarL/FixJ family response regulator
VPGFVVGQVPCQVVAVANQGGAGSGDGQQWQVWICLEGLDRGIELERTVRDAGFPVSVVQDGQRLQAGVDQVGPVVVILSDAVDRWLRIVGDLHRSGSLIRILLITDLDDRLELVAALSAGVDGIGRPGDPPEAILRSIISVRDEGVSLPRALVKDLVGEVRVDRGHSVRSVRGTVRVTDREWQILQLMLQNLTTKEMAAELFIAVGTVRSHVSSVLGKLGVRSRHEARALLEHKEPMRREYVTEVSRQSSE